MFGIDDAIAQGAKLIDDVVARIWPDATEVEKTKLAQLSAQIQNEYNLVLQQLKIDETEAASGSMFVAGWRPFIGWVCGVGLAYQYVLRPLLSGALLALGYPAMPALELESLVTLLLGMLGMGGLRTYEKSQGIHRDRLK